MSDDDSFYSACNISSFTSSDDSFYENADSFGNLLSNALSQSPLALNVCHLNAQSIPAHYTDLLDSFGSQTSSVVHAILVSESWLKPSLPTTAYSLPGFVLIRNDRTDKRGGGVAIYIRSEFTYKVIASSPSSYSASAEYLFIEVQSKRAKALLGVIYCPPSVNYFSSLESLLEAHCSDYAHHIIMGDLNTDLLKSTSNSNHLLDIVKSVNLSILPSGPTHHNPDASDSLLDLIFTSSRDHVILHGQLPAPGFSRHDAIYLSYKLRPPKLRPKIVMMRCLANIDNLALLEDAAKLDFSDVYTASTVDDKVACLNAEILALFDKHAPLKAVRMKRQPAPWITRGVRMAMSRRDKAFRKFKRDRCAENWSSYKIARNKCNKMVRAAKRSYILENISNSSSANIWKFLHSLGFGKMSTETKKPSFTADDFNRHFISVPFLNSVDKSCAISEVTSMALSLSDSFTFSPVTVEEVRKVLLSIKSGAVGYDGVSRAMILPVLQFLLPVIAHVINFSLSTGVFPSVWRKALVTPIPKIASPCELKEYRPISILPFLSKVLEAIVHKQISTFINGNNLLSPFQSGFRPGHSTTTALLKVTEDIRGSMEGKMVTILVLIDFSNAFNMVDHDILLSLLARMRFSSTAQEWFSSYLRDRQQAVKLDGVQSSWCNLSSGVPQGGILSPILFSIFINSLTRLLGCSYHLYADDLQIYTHADVTDISSAVNAINSDLLSVSNWSRRFGIKINPGKCQAIIVGSPRQMAKVNVDSVPPVTFEGQIIAYCSSVKDLGIYIDSTLSWRTQVAEVCRAVTASLSLLNRHRHFLPTETKAYLIQALIFPIIDYGDVCYLDLSEALLDKLDRLINHAVRFVFCLRKYDHISSYRSKLKWLPVRMRRQIRILGVLSSILFEPLSPEYLKSKFHFLYSSHDRQLRSTESYLLSIPLHRSGFLSNSFAVQAARFWNSLPDHVRRPAGKFTFKKRLRAHLWDL